MNAVAEGPIRPRLQTVLFDRLFYNRAEKCCELVFGSIGRRKIVFALPSSRCRMAIDFSYAVGQVIEKAKKKPLRQGAAVI